MGNTRLRKFLLPFYYNNKVVQESRIAKKTSGVSVNLTFAQRWVMISSNYNVGTYALILTTAVDKDTQAPFQLVSLVSVFTLEEANLERRLECFLLKCIRCFQNIRYSKRCRI